ncbi:MAG: Gfo/Idh/MocA family protein [Phycisphaerae bacterium]
MAARTRTLDCSDNDDRISKTPALSRRDFLLAASAAAAASTLVGCAAGDRRQTGPAIRPGGVQPDKIRVGVIGCGGRGTGAAIDCVKSSANVEITALGDLFKERVDSCRAEIEKLGEASKATEATCFAGFDAYKQVLASPVDLVILAAPPGFRPPHYAAAIDAGKHVFMEKPVAVDPAGIRTVLAASQVAVAKRLAVVAGTQRRHQPSYLEAMERIHDGAIGDIVAAQCYWNQEGLWVKKQESNWSDMEWQCRNWLYFTWLSGDHIVEQHVHNLDVVNWAFGGVPTKCMGMGGRQWRTAAEYGNVFDHFAIDYEYAGGARVISMCRQIDKTSVRIGERIVGTRGVCKFDGSNAEIVGKKNWKFDDGGKPVNPYVQEHADLIDSIRSGKPLNEGKQVAESTMTAIMGRMSAYTGRELQWDWAMNASKLDLTPEKMEFGPLPVGEPAMPGVTALV